MSGPRPKLILEHDGNRLVLHAYNALTGFTVVFTSLSAFCLLSWLGNGGGNQWFGTVIGTLIGVSFVAIGLGQMLPREIHVVFDRDARTVHHEMRFCRGFSTRRLTCGFDEIAAVGLMEYDSEGMKSFKPFFWQRSGKAFDLAVRHGDDWEFCTILDEVCDFTGLRREDDQLDNLGPHPAVRQPKAEK